MVRCFGCFGCARRAQEILGEIDVRELRGLAVLALHVTSRRSNVRADGECGLRAFGPSETGRSFVPATPCALTIFSRALA
jgi:hypothetical protein